MGPRQKTEHLEYTVCTETNMGKKSDQSCVTPDESGPHFHPLLQSHPPEEELWDAIEDSASSRVGRAMTQEENLFEIILV